MTLVVVVVVELYVALHEDDDDVHYYGSLHGDKKEDRFRNNGDHYRRFAATFAMIRELKPCPTALSSEPNVGRAEEAEET